MEAQKPKVTKITFTSEWTCYRTGEGKWYFVSASTKQSQWNVPQIPGMLDALTSNADLDRIWVNQHLGGSLPPPTEAVARESQLKQRAKALQSRYASFNDVEVPPPTKELSWLGPGTWTHAAGLESYSSHMTLLRAIAVALAASYPSCFGGQAALEGQWQRLTLNSLNPDAILRPEVRQMLAAAPEEFLNSTTARQALAEILSSSYSGHAGLVSILSSLWDLQLRTKASSAGASSSGAAKQPTAAGASAAADGTAKALEPGKPAAAAPAPAAASNKRRKAGMIVDDEDEEEESAASSSSSSSSSSSLIASSLARAAAASSSEESEAQSASSSSLDVLGPGAQEIVLTKLVTLFRQAYGPEVGTGLMALLPEHPLGDDANPAAASGDEASANFSWLSRVLLDLMKHAQWRACLIGLSENDKEDIFLRRSVQLMARHGYHNDVIGTAAVATSLSTHVVVLREAITKAVFPFNGGILDLVITKSGGSSSSSSAAPADTNKEKQHLHLHVVRGVATEAPSSPSIPSLLLSSTVSRKNAWSNAWVYDSVPHGLNSRRMAARRLASSEYGTLFSSYALQQAIAMALPPHATSTAAAARASYLASRYKVLVSGVSTSAPRQKKPRLKLKLKGSSGSGANSTSSSVIDLTKADTATPQTPLLPAATSITDFLTTVAVPDNTRTAAAIRLGRFRQDVGIEALVKRTKGNGGGSGGAAGSGIGAAGEGSSSSAASDLISPMTSSSAVAAIEGSSATSSASSSTNAAAAAAAATVARYLAISPLHHRLLLTAGPAAGTASTVLQGLTTIRTIALHYFSGLKGEFFPDESWPFLASRSDESFHPNLSMPASAPVQKAFGGTLITSSSSTSSGEDGVATADSGAGSGSSGAGGDGGAMDIEGSSSSAGASASAGVSGGAVGAGSNGLLAGGKEGQQINSPGMVDKRKGALLTPLVISAADIRLFLTALYQVASFLFDDETLQALIRFRKERVKELQASATQVLNATTAATTTAAAFHRLQDQINAVLASGSPDKEAMVASLQQQQEAARVTAEEAHATALQAQAQHEQAKAELEHVDSTLSQGSALGQVLSQPDVISLMVHLLFHPNTTFTMALCRGTPVVEAARAELLAANPSASEPSDGDINKTATELVSQVLALALWNANTGTLSNALVTAKASSSAGGNTPQRMGSKLDALVIGSYNRGTANGGVLPALPGAQAVDLTSHCLPPALLFSRFGGETHPAAATSKGTNSGDDLAAEEEASARENAHVASLKNALIEASRAIKADSPGGNSLLYPLTSLISSASVPAGFSLGAGSANRPVGGAAGGQAAQQASLAAQGQLASLLFKSLAHPVVALGSLHAIRHALLQQTLGDDPRLIPALAMLHRYALAISDAWPLLSLHCLGLLRQSLTVYPSVASASAVTQHREVALGAMVDMLLSGSGSVVMPLLTYARLQAESGGWDLSLLRYLITHILKGISQPVSVPFALEFVRLLHATQAKIASRIMATLAVSAGAKSGASTAGGAPASAPSFVGLGSGVGPLGNLPKSVTMGSDPTAQVTLQRFLERTFKEFSEANLLYQREANHRAGLSAEELPDLDENEEEDAPLLPDKVSGASVEAVVQGRHEVVRLIEKMNAVFTKMGLL
jgi:TH1 protein